jgi:hypothetical protein
MLPLRLFGDYLAYTIGAQIALILVEPKDTGLGRGYLQRLRTQNAKSLTFF